MAPNITTPVCINGHLYLLAKTDVVCMEAKTGKVKWSEDSLVLTPERRAFAAFIGMGNNVLMLNDLGELILFKADPGAYQEVSRVQVCGKNWCHPAYADGKLVVLGETGQLVIADASPEKFNELASARILEGKCWTAPVLANGLIYARTAAGDLVCVDVRGE